MQSSPLVLSERTLWSDSDIERIGGFGWFRAKGAGSRLLDSPQFQAFPCHRLRSLARDS